MSGHRVAGVRELVRRCGGWLRREFTQDVREWRSDQPVRRTVVGVLEMVFAIGVLMRAGLHGGAMMIAYGKRFFDEEPEIRFGVQPGHSVVRGVPLGVDLTSRLTASLYAYWWLTHPPSLVSVSPVVDVVVAGYFVGNLGFVLLDPVWLVVDRVFN